MKDYILLTGGLGYIGSHTAVRLMEDGHNLIILDNLSNSNINNLDRIKKIGSGNPVWFYGDINDNYTLENIFSQHSISSVIHFAGLKNVSESFQSPLSYYHNNVSGSVNLFRVMEKYGVRSLIFSSTANVYGKPLEMPISENHQINPNNPYGKSKYIVENLLLDLWKKNAHWNIIILRYFNPAGAHESGLIGELSSYSNNTLMSRLCHVASDSNLSMAIYGKDYDTLDGTPIRDFIHVSDLAEGHEFALKYQFNRKIFDPPLIVNLGTGIPTSVLQIIKSFSDVTGIKIKYKFHQRRPGDISVSYTDPSLAKKIFNWKATRSISKMCEDAWRWRQNETKN